MIEKQTNFGKISTKLPLPDLLDMQKNSFKDFLQENVAPSKRELKGLQAAFADVFPVEAPDGSMKLEFIKYDLCTPRYATPAEATVRDSTSDAPLKATMRLDIKQKNGNYKVGVEQDVTLCNLPLMTDAGCFVFNGAERVVVSQMHRSPGIIFEEDEEKIHFLYLVDGLVGIDYAKDRIVDKRKILIDSHTFDNDALIMKGITSNKISLKNKETGKTLLTMDFTGFPYLAIWSKPNAPFICIEPWYSTADSVKSTGVFTQKQDIISLKPNTLFECKYTVEFF